MTTDVLLRGRNTEPAADRRHGILTRGPVVTEKPSRTTDHAREPSGVTATKFVRTDPESAFAVPDRPEMQGKEDARRDR